MINELREIFLMLSNKNRYIKIGITSDSKSKVISLCKDVNSVWEISLSSNVLLESCRGGSSTVNFSIEQTNNQEMLSKTKHVFCDQSRVISSSKSPSNVASSISDMRTN